MDLSVKTSAILIFTMIAAGGAIGEFALWRETSRESAEQATSFYQERKVDVNTYVHGIQYPQITVDKQHIRLHESFDPKAWVSVTDAQDGTITSDVEVYGEVDNTKKGEYELRYVARNSYGLKSTKRIKVIVD